MFALESDIALGGGFSISSVSGAKQCVVVVIVVIVFGA
jgi:hypothetical protein